MTISKTDPPVNRSVWVRNPNVDRVTGWLKASVRKWLVCNCALAACMMALCAAVVLITKWVIYLGLFLCFIGISYLLQVLHLHDPPGFYNVVLPIGTWAALVYVFVDYFRTGDVDYISTPNISRMSNLATPQMWSNGARVFISLLHSAPKFTVLTWELVAKCHRLFRLNVPDCAKIITLLATAGTALPFREICERIPHLNPVKIFPQLKNIDGVLFLTGTGRLILTSAFREEMRGFLKLPRMGANSANDSSKEDILWEATGHYGVLGVEPSISTEKLKSIYRKLMKENHPDLVSGEDQAELKTLAEERSKEINEAYHAILAERKVLVNKYEN